MTALEAVIIFTLAMLSLALDQHLNKPRSRSWTGEIVTGMTKSGGERSYPKHSMKVLD